jgi:hypothetical protein
MSKSPLSGAFSGSSEPAKKKKKNGAILLIAGIALTSSIGGVFAANSITINSGAAIEFGQGVASTTSCDTGLTTSMTQSYVTGTTFRVGNVVVSGVDDTNCSGKDLRVALVDSSNAEVTSTLIRVASGTASYTWAVTSANVTADVVRKITVTSQN